MSTFKNLFIAIITTICLVLAITYSIFYYKSNLFFFDLPKHLSKKAETIEVYYINWACDCPDFIETKYRNENPDYETKAEDCIFIESASTLSDSEIFEPTKHAFKTLSLTGQFYSDKGISRNYEKKTPERPQHARVFQYTKLEVVE